MTKNSYIKASPQEFIDYMKSIKKKISKYEQELTEDLISIIHYFTMKSYSHRRKLNKIRKELEEAKK